MNELLSQNFAMNIDSINYIFLLQCWYFQRKAAVDETKMVT